MTTNISFLLNGDEISYEVKDHWTLLHLLREEMGLIGTKEGCGNGECGACTVIMNGKKVNSCMVLAAQAQGAEILTVEGVENPDGSLHPIQEAFVEKGAVQCGFCTSGMIISSYKLLSENQNPSEDDIKEAISGNLCRCTGYKQIVNAVTLAADKMRNQKGT